MGRGQRVQEPGPGDPGQGPRSRPLDAKADTAEVFTTIRCCQFGWLMDTSVGLALIKATDSKKVLSAAAAACFFFGVGVGASPLSHFLSSLDILRRPTPLESSRKDEGGVQQEFKSTLVPKRLRGMKVCTRFHQILQGLPPSSHGSSRNYLLSKR